MRFFELGRVVLRFRWEDERVAFAGDSAEALRTETENLNISGRTTGSRSPAGPRRLRERPQPRPKNGKVLRSDTRPGDVRERAERSEGSDTTPTQNAPCFGV